MKLNLSLIALSICLSGIFTPMIAKNSIPLIIPEPVSIQAYEGYFAFDQSCSLILTSNEGANSAEFLKKYLKNYYGININVILPDEKTNTNIKSSKKNKQTKTIVLSISDRLNTPFSKNTSPKLGEYVVKINEHHVFLTGANAQGLFYAVQSFIQLLPVKKAEALLIKQVEIYDYPRFEYRGMHLDVARHIYSVDYIKRYIDYLSLHKMNFFHWHLTDDQGWRMESKSYPKLNEIGSWRDGSIIGIFPGTGVDSTRYGGYYTIAQMKEVIAYAADRYITVVPEIDVPGHSMAIIAAYPQFSTTPEIPIKTAITWGIYNRQNNVLAPSEEVFKFLEDVFNELMDVFPSKYIHIGADECAKKWWKESKSSQEFMKKYGLKDENELQKYFAQRIAQIIKDRGREFIGWDEMLDDGLVDGAIVMSWRNEKGAIKAAELGHKAIMTPMLYSYFNIAQKENEDSLCHIQWLVSLDSVYMFEPVPDSLSKSIADNIIGGQGCMWTEYFPNSKRLEYGIFPRMSAIAEVYWSPKEKKNWSFFCKKLIKQFDRYDLWGANYCSDAKYYE